MVDVLKNGPSGNRITAGFRGRRGGRGRQFLRPRAAIFLAFQKQETIKQVLKTELSQMEEGKPSRQDIARVADTVKQAGYAWIDGQVFHGIRAIAAPIFDPQGALRAAMSLVSNQASLVRFPSSILDDLLGTTGRIS